MEKVSPFSAQSLNRTIWTIFFILIGIALVIVAYPYFKMVIVLFVISWIISVILNPMVDYLESVGLNRAIAIFLIMFLIITLIAGSVALIVPAAMRAIDAITVKLQSDFLKDITLQLEKLFEEKFNNAGLARDLIAKLIELGSGLLNNMGGLLKNASSFVAFLGIIPFVTFFLIKDRRLIYHSFIAQIPNKYFELSLNVLHKVGDQVTKYIQGQAIDALIVGLLSALGLFIVNLFFGHPIPYFFFIGMIAGIANLIPYLGPIVGAVPAITLTILNAPPNVGTIILWIVVVFALVQAIDNNIVSPMVVSKSVNMHPITVVIAVILGGNIAGVIGMLVAVPVWGIIKVTVKEISWGVKHYKLK